MAFRSTSVSNRRFTSTGSEHDRLRGPPYYSSVHGSVYYTPQLDPDWYTREPGPRFPPPLIQARQRRPHSIHIVSYPPGFIPYDLRPSPPQSRSRSISRVAAEPTKPARKTRRQERKDRKQEKKKKREEEKAKRERTEKRRSVRSLPPGGERVIRVLDKIFAAFSITPKSSATVSTTPAPRAQSRPTSFVSFARRLSRIDPVVAEDSVLQAPEQAANSQPAQQPGRPSDQQPSMAATTTPRPTPLPAMNTSNRNSMISIRSAKNMMNSSITELQQKPVASGSGVTCSIILAEPNVFLSGFDHDSHSRQPENHVPSALLRGRLQLNVSKNVKIKSVTLKLVGKARTEWPEGIPPMKTDLYEEQTLRTQSLVFFHAMHQEMWETEYGSQCTFSLKPSPIQHNGLRNSLYSTYSNHSNHSLHILNKPRQPNNLTAKELKRLSLQSVNSRSFGKGDSPFANQVQARGYKVFYPGTYEYAFELPIDHNQLETTKLQYGSVRWELETTVERAGAFKPNLHGTKEVSVVRLPDQMSLEMSEPISISRQWEDQLHYDIMISGKSFPIGTKIPIAFKLTPLAKVQVHKLKVFVTESIEYWTNDRRVTRKDTGRKILLLEKSAGKPVDKQFSASEIRVVTGGELPPEQREEARRSAAARRTLEASRNNGAPAPLPEPCENILGDLDLGLESFWGSTEIEMNVQIPTCEMMTRDKLLRLHPDCSWKNVNVFHWIKVGLGAILLAVLYRSDANRDGIDRHAHLSIRPRGPSRQTSPPFRDQHRQPLHRPQLSRYASQHVAATILRP